AVDEHLVAEALTTVGQQTAESRIAWALVRLSERAERVGLSSGPDETPLPFRQQDLADAMGLSLVHTNKTLRRLLERGYARWSDGVLTVTDRRGLRAAAGLAVDDETMPTRRPLI
ncbi:MAG: helix-turn-helix domain-containing protein, partial [Pseudomonadota bacterium]